MEGSQATQTEDLPGLQGACDDVEARLAKLLEENFGGLNIRELAASVEFSRSLVTVGSRPQRGALERLTALGLLLLSKMPREQPASPPVPRAYRLQAPAVPLDGVDLDGNLIVAPGDE